MGSSLNEGKTPVRQRRRHKIRRLNFDEETVMCKNSMSVCKVLERELPRFVAPKDPQRSPKRDPTEPAFLALKSSLMQVFNSFSRTDSGLSQTLCQSDPREALSRSKGVPGSKKICCNCKKSHCLKLYCECFLNKVCCSGCKCVNCMNTEKYNEEREKAMQATLVRNPTAFVPKISIADPSVLSFRYNLL